MDIHVLCAHSSTNRHVQFPFFILTNYATINTLYECPKHMYTSISIRQTPRNLTVGLKGVCVKKIQNPTKSPSPKGTVLHTVTVGLDWVSSHHLTCITLDIINIFQPYSWKTVTQYFMFPRLLMIMRTFF